jgi:DNA primase
MESQKTFEEVRDEIKGYLPQYLAKFGIDARDKKRFHCLNPSHPDKHPTNCGIIPGTDLWHCFACGMTGDIFDAANCKENKPLSGRGFFTDNLMYLAKTFGVTMPELNISDEEMHLIEARRAYSQAARIVQSAKRSKLIADKLAEYMWPEDVIQKIGIGCVESFDSYMKLMTEAHGHSAEFLKEINLDARGIFNENALIYTIRDEHGSPIAFSSRNLRYEAEMDHYRSETQKIKTSKLTDDECKTQLEALWKPRKYVNTKDTILFSKSKTLFNFCEAKKSPLRTLLVFEGNADCVTLYAGGVKTAVATCGTAFTPDQLELAMANGIRRIVLVFDPDAAGEKGTERFVKMLEQFGGHPGLEVEIIAMPAGTDDPDAYVRAFGDLKKGVLEFRKLPLTDLFTWKLKKMIEEGADPIQVANESIPVIVNIENNMLRLKKANLLATATNLPKEFIHRELLRLLDSNEMKADEERTAIARQTIKALQENPHAMDSILATASARSEAIANNYAGYDPETNLKAYRATIVKMEACTDVFELVTGYPIFDDLMGGIPKEGVMISLPGKPHHGKSIWLDNLVVHLLEHNPNLQIFLHHVDDAALLRIPRILGVMSGLSSRLISKAGVSLSNLGSEEFEDRYLKAQTKLDSWIEEERLVLADQAALANGLPAHERWVKEIRRRNADRYCVSIGDNFHLFDMPGMEPGENKVREMSKFISTLPTKHGITTMFSMEIPKDILKPGIRPKYTDSKNSGGIAFDSKVNMNIYQELQDLGEDTCLTWKSEEFMEQITQPDGTSAVVEKVMPIVEVIVDKNKVTGEKKTIFYRLEPMSGRMEECSLAEQSNLQMQLSNAKANRAKVGKSYAENSRSI